jgi:hypothetical protein
MSLWMEHLNELAHYNDLLREAEQNRLIRLALEECPKRHPVTFTSRIFYKGLGWLGDRLSSWGEKLQERYGTSPAATTFVRPHSE